MTAASPVAGDVVTVNYTLRPAAETSTYDQGVVSFVLGGGNYATGLHDTITTMKCGDSVTGVPIDAGFGEFSESACATLDIEQAPAGLKAGMTVMLQVRPSLGSVGMGVGVGVGVGVGRGWAGALASPRAQVPQQSSLCLQVSGGKQRARVTEMTDTSFTLDANHPLAGKKLDLDVELLSVDAGAAAHETAIFAGGCFWGVELAFQREPGVVGTKVGYCQGDTEEPSYEQVCSGATGHTEAVSVVFDPKVATYGRLCELLVDRLGENVWLENQVGNDRGTQYRSGIYPHSKAQREVAEACLAALWHPGGASMGVTVKTEVEDAARFWDAEDYHQQYLQKNGQDASKDAKETIRCYG